MMQLALSRGIHPHHVTAIVPSQRGGFIKLTAAVSESVDVWGSVGKGCNPLYPPRNPDKSIAKYGGVEGYKNSPDRGLFYHITIGQYLAFVVAAKNHFSQN